MMEKNKFLAVFLVVAIIAVAAHAARRGRPVITDPVAVNPLDGYAGQVQGDDYMNIAPSLELDSGAVELLDNPLK